VESQSLVGRLPIIEKRKVDKADTIEEISLLGKEKERGVNRNTGPPPGKAPEKPRGKRSTIGKVSGEL